MTTERYERVKRRLDLAGAAVALILTLPVLAGVAILVRLTIGSPVLFRQSRPGRHGLPFVLVKFRTMRAVDHARNLVTDADRLTTVGAALRATSLDELPSLLNVIRGDMSLIGPRPLLTSYLTRYTAKQARRHDVRPGITGLAQVRGRNATTWQRRLALDAWYVDHRSLALDLRILIETIRVVSSRRGVRAAEHATMPEFRAAAAPAEPGRISAAHTPRVGP